MAKKRTQIPRAVAARVLFDADRTCCVCREPKKPVQIHHIDGDPTNHDRRNLAPLCFDCHHQTQISGGFARGLDSDQIQLYRDDWNLLVAKGRASALVEGRDELARASDRAVYTTSVVEGLRENGEWTQLADFLHRVGNSELRDKYIETALAEDPTDFEIIHLRSLQGRPDLVPDEVAERRLAEQLERKDWNQRARTLVELGRSDEAAHDHLMGILESLDEGVPLSAAYYLRELVDDGLITSLFESALSQSETDGDLWWQIRALQELGRTDDLCELLQAHEDEIRTDPFFSIVLPDLLDCLGDHDEARALRAKHAGSWRSIGPGIVGLPIDNNED